MKVAIRVDSSLRMGNGHLVRCLGLAEVLARDGASVHFFCAQLRGGMSHRVAGLGYELSWLPLPAGGTDPSELRDAERREFEQADAFHLAAATAGGFDVLVVDHYALARAWECAVRHVADRLACIDDLADRAHDCDLLVDHNPGRVLDDYAGLAPQGARRLLGPRFALLRPEFAEARAGAGSVRAADAPMRLLVSMGGTDADNSTLDVLEGLETSRFSSQTRVRVILGPGAPSRAAISRQLDGTRFEAELLEDPPRFAQRVAECDAAIGAGGVSALERCCLGVPSFLVLTAGNQRQGAQALASRHAVLGVIERAAAREAVAALDPSLPSRQAVACAGQALVDGQGVRRVADAVWSLCSA